MKTCTVDDIMAAEPCEEYPRERIEGLFSGRTALTAREIVALDIPMEDRLWAVFHVYLDKKQARLFVCDCADEMLSRFPSSDPRSVEAVVVSRRHARGEATDEELSAARSAAKSAVKSAVKSAAARYASRSAAGSAVRAAARHGSRSAAWGVVMDTSRVIYWIAVSAAMSAAQVAGSGAACDAVRVVVWDSAQAAVYEKHLSLAIEYAEGVRS